MAVTKTEAKAFLQDDKNAEFIATMIEQYSACGPNQTIRFSIGEHGPDLTEMVGVLEWLIANRRDK